MGHAAGGNEQAGQRHEDNFFAEGHVLFQACIRGCHDFAIGQLNPT